MAMNTIFYNLIGHNLEVYIDDVIIISNKFIEHLIDFQEAFKRMSLKFKLINR
jgi:hypothetical protein